MIERLVETEISLKAEAEISLRELLATLLSVQTKKKETLMPMYPLFLEVADSLPTDFAALKM